MSGLSSSPSGVAPGGAPGEGSDDVAPRWGIADAIGVFLLAQVSSAIGVSIYLGVRGLEQTDLDHVSIGHVALLQVPLWTVLLGGPLVLTAVLGNGAVRDLGARMQSSDVPKGLAIGIACQFILVPLVTFPFLVLTDTDADRLSEPARELSDRAEGWGVLILALVVVVMAPLAEELFFRGFLQRSLLQRLRTPVAIGLTAIVFGLSHFQLLQFPALMAFGLVLGVLVHRSGRLGISVWAHVGFNAATVIVLVATR